MSQRKETLKKLAAGLRMAAEAAEELCRAQERGRRLGGAAEIPRVEIASGELTEVDRARARAAARRRGLKVIRDPEVKS